MLTKERISAWLEDASVLDVEGRAMLASLALLGLERDTRAERIGRAVLRELSDQGVELPGLRNGYASEGGIIAVIADAMEDEA